MLSLPPLTLAFAAQAPAFLQHTAEWMQSAFFVQGIGQPFNRATHIALSLSALTDHGEMTLRYPYYFYVQKWGEPTPETRLERASHVIDRLFSGLAESDQPIYRSLILSLIAHRTEDSARGVLDYGAAVMVRALQAIHQDQWTSALHDLRMRTYLDLSSALEAFGETEAARALLLHAPRLGLGFAPWSADLLLIADKLEGMGEAQKAEKIRTDMKPREDFRPAMPVSLGPSFVGGAYCPCPPPRGANIRWLEQQRERLGTNPPPPGRQK